MTYNKPKQGKVPNIQAGVCKQGTKGLGEKPGHLIKLYILHTVSYTQLSIRVTKKLQADTGYISTYTIPRAAAIHGPLLTRRRSRLRY